MKKNKNYMLADDAMAGRPATKEERECQPYSSLEWYGNTKGFLGLMFMIDQHYREELNNKIERQKIQR